jgi:hypothetical protein
MKKIALFIFAAASCLFPASHVMAQDGTAFDKGTVVATVGYGFPDLYRTSLRVAYNGYNSRKVSGIGPLILKGDYGIVKFKWGHSVGAGIVVGYSHTKVKFGNDYYYYGVYTPYTQTDSYNTITVGARGTYHFFTKEKFDCYASIGLGYNINTYTHTTDDPRGASVAVYKNRANLYSAFTVGIRYYFSNNFGVYSELGWDMSAPIQAGIALKF